MLIESSPAEVGLDPDRWDSVLNLLNKTVKETPNLGVALQVTSHAKTTGVHLWGTGKNNGERTPVKANNIFLIASLTKPMLALGVLMLVERGQLSLAERASRYLDDFRAEGRITITVHQLLCHASGLIDLPENNTSMRAAEAGIDQFWEAACTTPLLFKPGTSSSYSSLAYLVLANLIEKITGTCARDFLRRELLEPLGMRETMLGLGKKELQTEAGIVDRILDIELSQRELDIYGDWNSTYWRKFGAPGEVYFRP